MPGGVPHWVLGTNNSICVGRHFYSGSNIRSSIIALVHTFLLEGAATNENHLETRTLLYQMLVFWSTRIDKTDVDGGFIFLKFFQTQKLIENLGAHIPDLSSEDGFLDVVYLGIFAILSPALDVRFYFGKKTPSHLIEEANHAVHHFHSLLHVFSLRFIILLEGELVSNSYVVDRLLGEFAAAAVGLMKGIEKDDDDGILGIAQAGFTGMVEGILQRSHSNLVSFYSRCLDRNHKHFSWTGPKLQILPRSEDINSILPLATLGELLDLPGQQIYITCLDLTTSSPPTSSAELGKRRSRDDGSDSADQRPEKRRG